MAIRVKHDDDHTIEILDEAAMTFMALVTDQLNAALLKNGVRSKRTRQKICEEFLFDLSYRFDAGWFQNKQNRFFPKVCFLERSEPNQDENLGDAKVVHIPTEASSWHEYAIGVVAQFFEEGETVTPPVQTGSYGMEDE